MNCGNCKYFFGVNDKHGHCRFNPPAIVDHLSVAERIVSCWPTVGRDHWCGKFKCIPSEEKEHEE